MTSIKNNNTTLILSGDNSVASRVQTLLNTNKTFRVDHDLSVGTMVDLIRLQQQQQNDDQETYYAPCCPLELKNDDDNEMIPEPARLEIRLTSLYSKLQAIPP